MSKYTLDIHLPYLGSSSLEVVLFPEDASEAPFTLTHLPTDAVEGDMEPVTCGEYPDELFVFEYRSGSWAEVTEFDDLANIEDELFGWDVIQTSVPA